MQRILTDRTISSLLVIGAYRDNEVSATHPLIALLNHLKEDGVTVSTIPLQPLSRQHLNQLIADTVNHSLEQTTLLADLVWHKTEGNPFFVTEFLQRLHTDKLLRFNVTSHQWEWNIEQIQVQDLTNNVVELLLGKLKQLPCATQDILKLATCIGAQFDLNTLEIICEQPQVTIFQDLKIAIQLGLIQPLSDLNANLMFENFRFGHDRIQQAAYTLIEADRKTAVHWRIGQFLWHELPPEDLAERLFEVTDHLNYAPELVTDSTERDQLAQLNLQAGRKAKSATAYQAASQYLRMGLKLVGPEGWQRCYDLTLNLHEEAVEVAYLNQDFERQEQLTAVLLDQARTMLDTVKASRIKILARQAHNCPLEAIDIGIETLNRLGLKLPHPNQFNLWLALQRTKLFRIGKPIPNLMQLPVMQAPEQLAIIQILGDIVPSGYQASVEYFILCTMKQVALSLRYGNTAASAFAYACYGNLLQNMSGDLALGYQFGRLGLEVQEAFEAKETQSKVLFLFNGFIRHWKEHLSNTIDSLHHGYQVGKETGDLEFAAYNLCWEATHRLLIGQALPGLANRLTDVHDEIARLQQGPTLLFLQVPQQSVAKLLAQAAPGSLTRDLLAQAMAQAQAVDNKHALGWLYTFKAWICYLLEDYPSALDSAQTGSNFVSNIMGTAMVAVLNFYDSLTRLALYPTFDESTQRQTRRIVRANQTKMRKWADHAPQNCQHKYLLVEAERTGCLGQTDQASLYYDQAIQLATAHDYPHEAALANELAAKFYLSQQRDNFALVYLRKAYYGYFHWGAAAKVKQLEACYPQLLTPPTIQKPNSMGWGVDRITTTLTNNNNNQVLDLAALLQASEAIASEIVLEQLLITLVQILIKSAGAQVGHLILEVEGQLLIEASRDLAAETQSVLQSVPIHGHLPQTLIAYVNRTQDSVLLDDASRCGSFTQDPYIQTHQPQSILCTPLLNHGQLSGILYLENNLTTAAFTPDRLETLQLLSGQAAIAIDNARLYRTLQDSELRYQQLANNVPGVIYQFRITPQGDWEIVYLSSGCTDMFELQPEQVLSPTSKSCSVWFIQTIWLDCSNPSCSLTRPFSPGNGSVGFVCLRGRSNGFRANLNPNAKLMGVRVGTGY